MYGVRRVKKTKSNTQHNDWIVSQWVNICASVINVDFEQVFNP